MDHSDLSIKKHINKPLVEKKRRERINSFLEELKALVLTALNKDVTDFAKMEKADILEMAVNHIKKTKPQIEKYGLYGTALAKKRHRQGYIACLNDTLRYLADSGSARPEVSHQVAVHLSSAFPKFEFAGLPEEENILPAKLQLAEEVEHAAARAYFEPQKSQTLENLGRRPTGGSSYCHSSKMKCEPHSTSLTLNSEPDLQPLDCTAESLNCTLQNGSLPYLLENQTFASQEEPHMWQPWKF
uniref:Hairy enhancer of split 9 n=1 Tax=Platynereis dumerilii TaxID=6359 RepID=S5UFB0_PLADU|nr:hairy enhancer of split 9 [Platynereis dumerilii]